MDILQNIIGGMSKEEIRNFKLYIYRTEKAGERKDELLFDFIKKNSNDYDEDKILKKLYDTSDKNALYRLKNRLLDDLGKSLLLHHADNSEYNMIQNYLMLSRIFQSKGQTDSAFYYLNKASKKATENEYVEWLDLIYGEYIKLSHETMEINPEEFISKRKKNREQLNKLQEIDDILAALIYRIKVSQNFAEHNTQILSLLQKTVNDFSKNKSIKNSSVLRFKIYQSVSRILLQKHDYLSLEKYLLKTYTEFSKEKLFNKNNHEIKLQMLTYLINSLFKNKKIELSLSYTEQLKNAMKEFDNYLYDKYLFYYYNSLVINYSAKNIDKAIEILQEAKENATIKKLPMYNVFIYLNLAVLNFDKKNYKEALRSLIKPMMNDAFKNLDAAWHLKLQIFELIIRYELNDTDYIKNRLVRIKKEFASLLRISAYHRQKQLLQIIELITATDRQKKTKQLKKSIQLLVRSSVESSSDSDLINYNDWLNSLKID
jgi:hypothetical protein